MAITDILLRTLTWAGLTTKNSNLTASEMDTNFIEIFEALSDTTSTSESSITVSSNDLPVTLTDVPQHLIYYVASGDATINTITNSGTGIANLVVINKRATLDSITINASSDIYLGDEITDIEIKANESANFIIKDNKAYLINSWVLSYIGSIPTDISELNDYFGVIPTDISELTDYNGVLNDLHVQGTDVGLDIGGYYEVTAQEIRETIDKNKNVTKVTSATYDVLETDLILSVEYTATGTVAIQLMTALVAEGFQLRIKDAGGNAGTNNITISTEGAETIDGAATATINSDYSSVDVYCDGSNWFIV